MPGTADTATWKRVAWFVGLWLAGAVGVGLLAYAVRLIVGI